MEYIDLLPYKNIFLCCRKNILLSFYSNAVSNSFEYNYSNSNSEYFIFVFLFIKKNFIETNNLVYIFFIKNRIIIIIIKFKHYN